MPDFSLVDEWLGVWETLQENGQEIPLDEFIARHCAGAAPELIAQFKDKVRALEVMHQQLRVAGIPSDDLSSALHGPGRNAQELQPGYEPIPGHVLQVRLGRGGFGEVWKASAPGGFEVALKFVRLERRVRATEQRALEAIKEIHHPNLLSVFGAYQKDDFLIIAMELAERTLDQRFREARADGLPGIPREELLEYVAEAAKGLDYLNQTHHVAGEGPAHGIQHCDIKPQNLLLSGGSVKVGDFGLARCLEHSLGSHTGSMTAAYAAPEFFKGQTSNHSDQYSLAVTYCLLRGGRLPFTGNSAELMAGHLSREPDLTMLPPKERPVVARALAKDPKDRWPSCGEFVKTLLGVGPDLRGNRWTARLARRSLLSRGVARWLIGGVAGCLILGFSVFTAWSVLGSKNVLPPAGETPEPEGDVPSLQATAPPGPVRVAVLDFENHSKDPTLDGFRQGLRDMLVTDLMRVSDVKVVERARLTAVLEEQKLAQGGFIDPRTAVRLGKGLAAQSLLTGSFVISGDEVRVDIRLISVESGEIRLADQVTGNKTEFFRLQQALAAKVLAGLQVHPTEQERHALTEPHTKDFEAFRLYSEALLAQRRGQQKEAEASLRQAVTRDPNFRLAKNELATIHAAALTRLADEEKQRLSRAGKVGKALEEFSVRHQKIIAGGQRDAAYFTSLIVLSAHAGLLGDNDRERKLLVHYWREFSEQVPVDQALRLSQDVSKRVATEGKVFQELVDSGYYGHVIQGLQTPESRYLKPGLQGTLRWPNYAVIWPFAPDLRRAYFLIDVPHPEPRTVAVFEKRLPHYPHHYLLTLLKNTPGREAYAELREFVRLQQSVVGFYARMKVKPDDLKWELVPIHRSYLRELGKAGPEKWDEAFVLDAILVLEGLATSESESELQGEANRLLLQFVQYAQRTGAAKSGPGDV